MGDFTHLTDKGEAAMVSLGAKTATARQATVRAIVQITATCSDKLSDEAAHEISRTARIAGIQAAKLTPQLVPLCHPIALTGVDLDIQLDRDELAFTIEARTATQAPTGVEMEAMCAASIASVTIYDMIKAVDPGATVGPMHLAEKHGGKHGSWLRERDHAHDSQHRRLW